MLCRSGNDIQYDVGFYFLVENAVVEGRCRMSNAIDMCQGWTKSSSHDGLAWGKLVSPSHDVIFSRI